MEKRSILSSNYLERIDGIKSYGNHISVYRNI